MQVDIKGVDVWWLRPEPRISNVSSRWSGSRGFPSLTTVGFLLNLQFDIGFGSQVLAVRNGSACTNQHK